MRQGHWPGSGDFAVRETSLRPQCGDRVEARGAPGRNDAGSGRDHQQRERDQAEDLRIEGCVW